MFDDPLTYSFAKVEPKFETGDVMSVAVERMSRSPFTLGKDSLNQV